MAQCLAEQNTFFIGTCQSNKKGIPDALKGAFEPGKTPRGESIGAWAEDDDGRPLTPNIHCMIWMDKQPVRLINTIAPENTFTTVKRRQPNGNSKNIMCPVAVKLYNSFMGGVDRADNLRKYCNSSRKSKRWYMRIFWYGVEVAIINSFVIMKEVNGEMLLKEFRLDLAEELIEKHCGRSDVGRRRAINRERFAGKHFPEHRPNTTKYCKMSCGKRPSYVCDKCNVRLCAAPCFKKYHT